MDILDRYTAIKSSAEQRCMDFSKDQFVLLVLADVIENQGAEVVRSIDHLDLIHNNQR